MPPLEVKFGSVTARVYPASRVRNGHSSQYWTVVYHATGKRHRRAFADQRKAEAFAKLKCEQIDAGHIADPKTGPAELASFARATAMIAPTGKPIELAAAEYAEAWKLLGSVPILDAVRDYVRRHPVGSTEKYVPEIVRELIASKRSAGLSPLHIADLECRLGKLADTFKCPIHRLTGKELSAWINALGLKPRTRNNYRLAIANLVAFSKANLYLPRDWYELEAVPFAKVGKQVIDIFSPDEISRLLQASLPNLRPFLAIGAFCGLRHAEILRLRWEDIGKEWLTVKAEHAKTGSRRLVPVPSALTDWLSGIEKRGPVVTLGNVTNAIVHTCSVKRANVKWKHNALRHSWISYRVAITQDVARVALEAGNSPRVIFSSYRELVTPGDARKWFAVRPLPGRQLAGKAATNGKPQ